MIGYLFVGFLIVQFGCSDQLPSSSGPPLETRKQWNVLNFNLPWDFPATEKEFNDPEQVVATGIAVGYDRIFVATPRLFSGVAATISTIPRSDVGDSPLLEAYPNWNFHKAGTKQYNCSELGFVSVYRMRIDSCDRLWALDAGVSRSLEDFEVTCPPKILVFDTKTDQVVRRIDFPREVIRGESLFTNLLIDETQSRPENNCDDVFVYISDTVEPAIVVYDSGKDLTWRLSHPAMYPDPNFSQSTILGSSFTLMDGIVGLAFDARINTVYFQPLATDRIFSIHTSALRAGPLSFGAALPVKLVGKKSSQGIGLAVSPLDGSIFFSPMSETAVAKWNPTSNSQSILARDQEQLQFVADIRAPSRDTGSIYILSSRFHRFFLKNLNANEINTRIMRLDGVISEPITSHFSNAINQFSQPPPFGNYKHPAFTNVLSRTSPPLYASSTVPHSNANPFFSNHREPYRFEQVGVINKAVQNPFAALNVGERPDVFKFNNALRPGKLSTPIGTGLGLELYQKPSNFHDFNGLRVTPSSVLVKRNASTFTPN